MNPSELEEELSELHDGPFGPVEFTAYVEQVRENEYELFISHLKVHDGYERSGLGSQKIRKAVQIAVGSGLNIVNVSIDIGGGENSKHFLQEIGFEEIKTHSEKQVYAQANPSRILQNTEE